MSLRHPLGSPKLGVLVVQVSHRLDKFLNIQDCIEKSLEIKFAMKSTLKRLKGLENLKSPWILPFTGGLNTVFGYLNQYIIVVPLYGAAYAAPNKGNTVLYYFFQLISSVMQSSILKVEFQCVKQYFS